MGVTIKAYPKVRYIEDHGPFAGFNLPGAPSGDDCENNSLDDYHRSAFAYAAYRVSAEGIKGWDEVARVSEDGRSAFVGGYCFVPDAASIEVMSISYSGYNRWRRILTVAMYGMEPESVWEHPDKFKGEPFIEVVNFADNEGCIGHVAAGRLADAFADHVNRATYARHVRLGGTWEAKDYCDVWDRWAVALRAVATSGGVVAYS